MTPCTPVARDEALMYRRCKSAVLTHRYSDELGVEADVASVDDVTVADSAYRLVDRDGEARA